MAFFIGILDGSDDVWGVRVPDVPRCNGGGATPEAAIQDAISALREMGHETRTVTPRDARTIITDPTTEFAPAAGESLVMLPFLAESGVLTRADISLDERHLAAIDEAANRRGVTRSAFLVSAAIDKIATGS
ncbi:DNA-binding protein [Hyphomicrobium methylovorum]|uniref:type II toxin-antitoxin system HicB family antitoxin n=1 Tax=Hyphomicrobium methylovorum TaxID=84 RepID=UPI0015E67FC0|nr:type II toxin-antitoxin system HicB family antitoxin [Hyphomicrobium methylovorum]MBA2126730.1 DNA-binding protein [Hyphomicrobium methylovorum]